MRLALLSDIHGNLTALDAVLDELEAEGIVLTGRAARRAELIALRTT
jgi:predicted phosphodiesterase